MSQKSNVKIVSISERKNNAIWILNFVGGHFRWIFSESGIDNKSLGNNDKFIADRHANVDFFRQRVSSTFVSEQEKTREERRAL